MTRAFGWHELLFVLRGFGWTMALSAVALVAGGLAGLAVALARSAPNSALRLLARGYIVLVQGTPVLMQLFLAFYGLAVLTGVRMTPWPAVVTAFTLYAAAFLGDIWRAALEAVPASQWEAGRALGLPRRIILLRVIAPQALRLAIPPSVGFVVQLVKSTAVAAIIGFVELTRAGQLMVNVTFRPMQVYPLVAALYFAICWPLSLLAGRLERRLDRGHRVAGPLLGDR